MSQIGENMSKNTGSSNFTGLVVLIIIAAVTSTVGVYIAKQVENKQDVKLAEAIKGLPSQYPDYDVIKGKNVDTKFKIVNITPKGGYTSKEPAQSNFDDISKRYKVVGKFSRAYLFIEAMVDNDRPLTSWDDIYFKINGTGGHLIPEGNVLPTPPGASSTYLYDMRPISYYPTLEDKMKKNKPEYFDMFSLLKDGSTIKIITTVSSYRPGRVLKEVSIYYECKAGTKCSIDEVVNK